MTVAVDISEYQPPVNDSYPHRWITFRVCDGSYTDRNAHANLAWCVRAKAAGKIDGFGVYVVYRPGQNQTILRTLDTLGVPHDCVVMVDAESWGGQISGNRSAELNALAVALSQRQESQKRVWGYGNRSDLASLWPQRPVWLGVVVASYGGSKPTDVANLVGWQYTDGRYGVTGLPSSSAPFGPCDHNELYLTATATPEVDLTPDQASQLADVHGWLQRIDFGLDNGGPTPFGQRGEVIDRERAIHATVGALAGQVAALLVAVKGLAGGTGVDPAAIAAAANAGATAALQNLTLKAQP